MASLYSIVFMGERVPGRAVEEIVAAFAARFRVSEQRARQVVLARHSVLKRGLDAAQAQRYSVALREVGLLVVLEPEGQVALAGRSAGLDACDDAAPTAVTAPVAPAKWPQCPQCGEYAVSPTTGVCQSCGLAVERYPGRRADPARAAGGGDNPYAPPAADLIAPAIDGSGERLCAPRPVSAGRGWGWVGEAWELFKDHPWAWIGAVLLYLLISTAMNFLPFIGGLAMAVLGPIFTGGLMIGAHIQYQGGGFEVKQLFCGFQRNTGSLALVGAASLGFAVLFLLVMVVLVALGVFILADPGFIAGLERGTFDPQRIGFHEIALVLLPALLALLLAVPLGMAVFFAPALVALNEVPVLRAFKLSFQGCWRNILPFLVFGLVVLGLSLASLLTLGLGLLVLMPVLIVATYVAYRDIYYR